MGLTVATGAASASAAPPHKGEAASPPRIAVQPGGGANTDIFFVPHQDDEVLTMGTLIADSHLAGRTTRVVSYTDGRSSAVCGADATAICQNGAYRGVPVATFVTDRDAEMTAAVVALGVPADHLSFNPNRTGTPRAFDGTVTEAYAAAVLAAWHAAYPAAHLWTMSWIDDHFDHAAMGLALRSAVQAGRIPAASATFSMFEIYNHAKPRVPGIPAYAALDGDFLRVERGAPTHPVLRACTQAGCLAAVTAALRSYVERPDGIGYASVPMYFESRLASGTYPVLIHDAQTRSYAGRTTLALRRGSKTSVAVNGACSLTAPAPAPAGSAETIGAAFDPVATRVAWSTGTVLLTYISTKGKHGGVTVPVRDGQLFQAALDAKTGTAVTAQCTGLAHVIATIARVNVPR